MRPVLLLLLLLLSAVRAPEASAAVVPTWPVSARPHVVRAFDPPAQRWLPGHRGVDVRAGVGTAVLAPVDGTVTFSGRVVHREVITVQEPGGRRHSFEPVSRGLAVGTRVRRGEQLAVVAAGHCPGGCLHWGVRVGGDYVDPLGLLPRPRAVLLPTGRLRATG